MNKKIDEVVGLKRNMSGRTVTKSKTIEERKKLPTLPTSVACFKPNPHFPSTQIPKSKKTDAVAINEARDRYSKLKSFSTMDEDFEKLELISNKNHLIRNNSLNIQQRLIEIASSSKLPVIKEINSSFVVEKRLNSQFGSVFQRYNENLKIKLRELEGLPSI